MNSCVGGSLGGRGGEVGGGAVTFRSSVLDGSIAGAWLGTAMGVGTAPRPPAARAVAEAGVEAVAFVAFAGDFAGDLLGAGSVVVVVGGAAAATAVPSSSQSISSSGATGAVDFLLLVVGFGAGGADEGAFLLSSSWSRATSSAFLPVCGRERAFSSSSNSAFFFLP